MTEAAAVWRAVSALVDPEHRRIERVQDADWLDELAGLFRQRGLCDVAAYRAATRAHAVIPSLWDQATEALATRTDDGTGSKPLRERSPADLDLMEIRSLIRDTTRGELEKRGTKTLMDKSGRQATFKAAVEIRGLASKVTADPDEDLSWWEYRFASWARLLSNYLRAAEHAPRSVRLRNAPCPVCRIKQVTIEQGGEMVVAPPILIDFRDGMVRAATCDACSASWFRGPDLERLALELNRKDGNDVLDSPGLLARSTQ